MKKKCLLFIYIFFCLSFGILFFNFQSNAATTSDSDSSTYMKIPPIGETIIVKNMKYKITGKVKATFLGPVKKNITTLTVPAKIKYGRFKLRVTKVGKRACYKCPKLKKVTLSNSVFSIEDEAFAKCDHLKTISFGTSTTVLGKKVLYQDKRLTKITFKSNQIQSIGKKTFRGVPKSVAIYVPTLSAKLYKKLIKKAK